jgi:hypothetical protein
MTGKYSGVQALISEGNVLACAAHTLNLVAAQAASSSIHLVPFFAKILRLFAFFSIPSQQ